jgi:hypothetical protein
MTRNKEKVTFNDEIIYTFYTWKLFIKLESTVFSRLCEIWVSHGGDTDNYCILRYDAAEQSDTSPPTVRRNLLPPSSGQKVHFYSEDDSTKPHGVPSERTVMFLAVLDSKHWFGTKHTQYKNDTFTFYCITFQNIFSKRAGIR